MRFHAKPVHICVSLAVALTIVYLIGSYSTGLPNGYRLHDLLKQGKSQQDQPKKLPVDVKTYGTFDIPGPKATQIPFNGTWNAARDANNLLLTGAQCKVAFSSLFVEVKHGEATRKLAHHESRPGQDTRRHGRHGQGYDLQSVAVCH
jgi:hypothetical protein